MTPGQRLGPHQAQSYLTPTIPDVGPHYERNVGNGQEATEVMTKLYYAQLSPYRRLIAVNRGGTLYYVHTEHLGGTIS
jgi:hypothetical protein